MSEYIYQADPIGEGQYHYTLVGELVRCGECERPQMRQPGMAYCPMIVGGWISNDFFCKYGERRADDDEK